MLMVPHTQCGKHACSWDRGTQSKVNLTCLNVGLPPSLISLPSLGLLHSSPLMEAVVLFEYEKQQDDEHSLKVGEVILDVKQVCS